MLAQSVIIHHHKHRRSGFWQPHWFWGDMHTGWRRFNSRGCAEGRRAQWAARVALVEAARPFSSSFMVSMGNVYQIRRIR